MMIRQRALLAVVLAIALVTGLLSGPRQGAGASPPASSTPTTRPVGARLERALIGGVWQTVLIRGSGWTVR